MKSSAPLNRPRARIEDAGYLVFNDPGANDAFRVRLRNGRAIALYDVTDDGAYRFGWVETLAGTGRRDCLSLNDFMHELAKQFEGRPPL